MFFFTSLADWRHWHSVCWPYTPLNICEAAMTFEVTSGLILAAALFIYLCVALLRPEKF